MEANYKRLNPEALSVLEQAAASGAKPYYDVTLEDARKSSNDRSHTHSGEFDFDGTIKNIQIHSQNVPDGIPAIVYRPNKLKENPPVLVYFHGGGFVVGCAAAKTISCQMLAQRCECIIVNVDYRLAPEHKFPCMMEDAREAVEWAKAHRSQLGGTKESIIGVYGDSAGGTMTASVCHDVSGVDFQILVYPRTWARKNLPSHKAFGTGLGLTESVMDWFFSLTYEKGKDSLDPRMTVCNRESFDNLPPALFIAAECDPIRDDSYVYAAKLLMAGVPADIVTVQGTMHGFFTLPGTYKKSCEEAYDCIEKFVNRMYAAK